ncbi:MAG TPA: hypothetical protein PKW76_09490 [bacterium]|nr:hypothetical protein [bacterium]HPG45902.1 hypothetical protein [bacterium]HPM97724.1 hypothetical protein [bacterium]
MKFIKFCIGGIPFDDGKLLLLLRRKNKRHDNQSTVKSWTRTAPAKSRFFARKTNQQPNCSEARKLPLFLNGLQQRSTAVGLQKESVQDFSAVPH